MSGHSGGTGATLGALAGGIIGHFEKKHRKEKKYQQQGQGYNRGIDSDED
jgi:hypothetical protein